MKEIVYNAEMMEKFSSGIQKLTEAVAVTLGPNGRNVVLWPKNSKPFATKDGVTVSKFIELSDPFENLAAQLVKEASDKTNSQVGDGTTTVTVLVYSMFVQALEKLKSGSKPSVLIKEMEETVLSLVEKLKDLSFPVNGIEQIEQVATISANGQKDIGELISSAIDKIGRDGSITIKDSSNYKTVLEIVEGYKFDSGYLLKEFINDEKLNIVSYENAFVLVTNRKIQGVEEIKNLLEMVANDGRPLIIIAEEVDKKVAALLLQNYVLGAIKIAIVNPPYFGTERIETLEDIALISGAKFFDKRFHTSLKDIQLSDLGLVQKIQIKKNETLIVDGNGDPKKVDKKIEILQNEFKEEKDSRSAKKILERINRLSSAVGIIHVGGHTALEQVERRHRVEDALEAAYSAIRGGLLPGGGCALVRASVSLESDSEHRRPGSVAMLQAVKAPFEYILSNADLDSSVILEQSKEFGDDFVFNVQTRSFTNYKEDGIIDPMLVTKTALQNAFSVVSILINTGCSIIEN